jgi:hypothetical protein
MSAPAWKWSVSYVKTQDLASGSSDRMMGELYLWTSTDWLGLMTTKGTPIVGKFLCKGEVVDVGSVWDFSGYNVKVIQCVHSPHVRRAATVNELMQMSGSDLNPKDQGWHVTYSTHRDLWCGRMKSYDGSLFLDAKHHWLLLKDAKGAMVGRRSPRSVDSFSLGSKLSFPNHEIRMGKPWTFLRERSAEVPLDHSLAESCNKEVLPSLAESSNKEVPLPSLAESNIRDVPLSADNNNKEAPSALPGCADLARKLDFSYGRKFKADVKKRLASTVHPLGKSNHFLLVVSFGRANFKLTEAMAGIALESCIGGIAEDMAVKCLNERVFRFSVASKAVGFMIFNLRFFSCPSFKCFFHLWSNGGPSWYKEFSKWQFECDKEWVLVSPNKKRTDQALAALCSTPQKSALSARKNDLSARKNDSIKKRLTFASEMVYPACSGYTSSSLTNRVVIAENIIKDG